MYYATTNRTVGYYHARNYSVQKSGRSSALVEHARRKYCTFSCDIYDYGSIISGNVSSSV
ncbi:hypothetical protein Cassandra_0190 [Pseudomonas phage Cassandra]|nr:hypothetical protein Cassandra_0190 [Pseudomonas phage Cassandra]